MDLEEDTAADDMVESWNPDRSVPDVITAFLGKDVGLPRRWLPQVRLSHLYWMFRSSFGVPVSGEDDDVDVASDEDDENVASPDVCPSWSTFHTVWQSTWKQYLRFRATS